MAYSVRARRPRRWAVARSEPVRYEILRLVVDAALGTGSVIAALRRICWGSSYADQCPRPLVEERAARLPNCVIRWAPTLGQEQELGIEHPS
jgi:hypothetical protein